MLLAKKPFSSPEDVGVHCMRPGASIAPLRIIAFLILIVTFTGCVSQNQDLPTQDKTANSKTPSRPFPSDTLYSLLVAEFAGARNHPNIALKNYTEQAQQTQDIGITRRATLIAQYLGADQTALENAELWSSLDPSNAEADAVLTSQLLKQGKTLESFDYSLKLLNKGYQPLFQTIAAQMVKSNSAEQSALLDKFNLALEAHPKNSPLLLGKALLHHFLNDDKLAAMFANKAIDADKSNSGAYLLKASLLEKTGERKTAAQTLNDRMQQEPYDQRVHLQYARLLASYDLPAAQKQFKLLVDKNPFDADLLLTLAIVSKEVGDKASAKEYFEQLLFIHKHQSSAYFYLGQISEDEKDAPRALELYRRVSDGNEYYYAIAAFCNLALKDSDLTQCLQRLDEERVRLPTAAPRLFLMEASILQDQKEFTRSLNTLNRALKQFPTDLELLYSRSMAQEQLGNLQSTEEDLRAILKMDANNANALNALGYVLSNKTDRQQEAYELITRALALEPKNPAIIDSLGWVLYRMNRAEEALPYLHKAMALYPNDEIAAHLGEVLWVSGKQKEARDVWKKGIDNNFDSVIIKETLQRLNVN